MNDKKQLTDQELDALWEEAQSRLLIMNKPAPISEEKAVQLLKELPADISGETLGDRIRQLKASSNMTQISNQQHKHRFKPITEITRLAADTSDQDFPLPEPGRPLETPDGRFRLRINAESQKIRIEIQALGFAAEEYANCSIALLSDNNATEAFAIIKLNQDGDGNSLISDTPLIRKALMQPVIALVDNE